MFHSKKSLGQNFLLDQDIACQIATAAEISDDETIIEIGPGKGILTNELLKTGAKILAIEKDFDLIAYLTQKFGNKKNLKIIHQDALFFDFSHLKNYKVVANLPFNVAAPILRKYLESENPPELMVVMVQKEVAQKIIASPGDSERGVLTLAIEYFGNPEIIVEVSKTKFRPQPKVDAAVIKIRPRDKETERPAYRQAGKKDIPEKLFFRIVKAGFASKRQQIHNSLAATLRLPKDIVLNILNQSNIDPKLRAEDLTFDQWLKLTQNFKELF